MKPLACSLMALGFALFMAGRAHARNVQLFVPIADAVAATDISDRPTGAVKFFYGTAKSPAILTYLGCYLALPLADPTGGPDTKLFYGHLDK